MGTYHGTGILNVKVLKLRRVSFYNVSYSLNSSFQLFDLCFFTLYLY